YFCTGTQDIKVNVKNHGNNVINNVQIQWTVGGTPQPPFNLTLPLDTFGGTGLNEREVTLGSYNFTTTPVNLKVWTTMPNGQPDTSNNNDTLNTMIAASAFSITAANDTICVGGDATITLQPDSGYATPSPIQWQSSVNGITFTPVT